MLPCLALPCLALPCLCLRIGREKLSVHVRKVRRVVLGGGAANTALGARKVPKRVRFTVQSRACGQSRVGKSPSTTSSCASAQPGATRACHRTLPGTPARPAASRTCRAARGLARRGLVTFRGQPMHTNMQRDLLQGPRAPRLAPCAAQPRALPRVHTLHRFGSARASSTRINAQHPMSQGRPPKACSLFLLCVSLPTARR